MSDDVSTSEEVAGLPLITVEGYQEYKEGIARACIPLFGRVLEAEELAELVAAPNNSVLSVEARGSDDIVLRLSYKWSKGTQDYIFYVDERTGRRIVEFDNIAIKDEAPYLTETRIFGAQVDSFRRFSLDEIRLFAAGFAGDPSGYNGYYVWARLGFRMSVDGFGTKLAKDGFLNVEDTLDLLSRNGGGEWWYNNGSEGAAVFYLGDSSPCLAALSDYLAEKGILSDDNDE